MIIETAAQAMSEQVAVEVHYGGLKRTMEIHAIGVGSDGRHLIRAWQVSGGSSSGERTGWKLLRSDDISSMRKLVDKSLAPRKGYRRDDSSMVRVIAQV